MIILSRISLLEENTGHRAGSYTNTHRWTTSLQRINSRWKNAIKNVDTSYIHTIYTYRAQAIDCECQFQLKANPPKANTSKMKLRKPDHVQLNQFNAAVASKALQEIHKTNCADLTFDQLNAILLQSAKDYLPIQPPQQKKEYISKRTWALLEQK